MLRVSRDTVYETARGMTGTPKKKVRALFANKTHVVSMTMLLLSPRLRLVPGFGSVTTAGDSCSTSKIASLARVVATVVVNVTSLEITAISRSAADSPSPTVYRNCNSDVPLPLL